VASTHRADRGMSLADSIASALDQAMAEDGRVLVVGEDVGRLGGVFRITHGLQAKYGPSRVIDTPLSEAAIVGSAIGMALHGLKPVVEIQFDGFIYPALNQICCHLARYSARANLKELPVVVRIPIGGRFLAAELHAENPETYFAHTPGLTVLAASEVETAGALLLGAIRAATPCIFLEPKRFYRSERVPATSLLSEVPIDKARTVAEGSDAVIISYGPSITLAKQASQRLATEGHKVGVLDLVSLAPIDVESVLSAVRTTGRVVLLTEAVQRCSIASELAALIATLGYGDLRAAPVIVASPNVPSPPAARQTEFFPTLEQLIAGVRQVLK
jgi:pyruvate/2-oxoglutarate/acetoin dehydrogenase E1 component